MSRTTLWCRLGLLVSIAAAVTGSTVADPPDWPNYPGQCAAEHGVCFHQFEGVTLQALDADGEFIFGAFDGDINDFMRQNPDGTNYLHFVSQDDNEVFYCPDGPEGECWSSIEPGRLSFTGLVSLNNDTGGFFISCPGTAYATSVHMAPEGALFEARVEVNLVPASSGGCRIIDFDVRIRPAPGT